ncbi:unnamed protein product [Pieris brassicae]|uniref:G-protein coupled receptors family 1 profile domain-containing protein n=1 Tax=Pieris brassicae TaxID=7116 RepID=A0A9P0TF12_PIEBR|nr:unnamed protein product [Pieris brassicae]
MTFPNSTYETSTLYIDKQFWDYFDGSSSLNVTFEDIIPRDQGIVITTYAALMAMGALGNLAILVTLARSRRRKSRVDLLMTHLAVADVCVTCGVIPLEYTRGKVMQLYKEFCARRLVSREVVEEGSQREESERSTPIQSY